MRGSFKRDMLRNIAWFAGLIVVVCALIGGSVWQLNLRKTHAWQLASLLNGKRARLEASPVTEDFIVELDGARRTLLEWHEMIDSQPLRIAALSDAAQKSGVSIISMESTHSDQTDSGEVFSRSHSLRSVGTQRQIAQFLDNLYGVRGVTAIDEVRIEPQDGQAPGLLETSLTVTWYAPGIIKPEEQAAEETEVVE